ncbi:hypothetical protein SAMN04488587_1336 [Methanococcoides vulcani]|uniref:Uncharacterized protein n=1 Tax=Methanococcoides vulcani TaxID=1353158 RepID=A0A1H9ZZG2_9EURY|nr:hypothetical protein [Methanococcoides vulcani]SES86308.1 hypothetical protein SAMN04488587_1336 [Methanococcoides vulcani]
MTAQDTRNYSYNLKENILYAGDQQVPAYELEENEIGTCGDCESTITSLSYHETDDKFIVVGNCTNCGTLSANIYDSDWNWISEIAISYYSSPISEHNAEGVSKIFPGAKGPKESETPEIDDLELLNSIPMKQIETIFSPTEITALFARAKGEKCIRQYLYNARKKYQTFEDVFGVKLTI